MNELIATLLQSVITVAVPILATFAVRWLNAKAEQTKEETKSELAARYIDEAADAVSNAVLHTSQTYVDALKANNQWTKENQAMALKRAITQARSMLTREANRFLAETYGDVSRYLETLIEAEIKATK